MISKINQLTLDEKDNPEAKIPVGQWNIPATMLESIPTISRRDFFVGLMAHSLRTHHGDINKNDIDLCIDEADIIIEKLDKT